MCPDSTAAVDKHLAWCHSSAVCSRSLQDGLGGLEQSVIVVQMEPILTARIQPNLDPGCVGSAEC